MKALRRAFCRVAGHRWHYDMETDYFICWTCGTCEEVITHHAKEDQKGTKGS